MESASINMRVCASLNAFNFGPKVVIIAVFIVLYSGDGRCEN